MSRETFLIQVTQVTNVKERKEQSGYVHAHHIVSFMPNGEFTQIVLTNDTMVVKESCQYFIEKGKTYGLMRVL